MTAFELAVQGVDGVRVARETGVDRIELCSALDLGGLTPSVGLIEAAVAGAGCPVHVLVRPRPGGFEHDADERRLVLADVRRCLDLGATGVVVGGTVAGTVGGEVDRAFVTACLEAAAGSPVTFHRAFDGLGDLPAALDTLVDLGVTRVLTSAGADRVGDALPALEALVRHAAGRIEIMAGGGVTSDNAAAVLGTGVDAVHASAKQRAVESSGARLGSAGGLGYAATDEAEVRRLLAAVRD